MQRGDRASRVCDSLQQKGGNKKVEEKLNLWGKIGRQYYTYRITSIRGYSKLIATV
jgi:hypothetical protein